MGKHELTTLPLDILLDFEYRFRVSILSKELLNLSFILQFFSCHDELEDHIKASSKKRTAIKALNDIFGLANTELKEIFNLLSFEDNNNKKFFRHRDYIDHQIFQKYSRIVHINYRLQNALKLLSFLQKKIKYTLEAFPPYFPSPTIFRARQEYKFYEGLEDMFRFFFANFLRTEFTTYSNINQVLERIPTLSVYWETNDENSFVDFSDFSIMDQDPDLLYFLFEGSFFIVNQPSLWPIITHECAHFLFHSLKRFSPDMALEAEELIKRLVLDIYRYVNRFRYSSNLYLTTVLTDVLVDSVLTYIFGSMYLLLIWRILFAFDEHPDCIYLPLRRSWFVRLRIPFEIYRKLKSIASYPVMPELEINEFDPICFINVLDKLQLMSINSSFRKDQANIRASIEYFIVSQTTNALMRLFRQKSFRRTIKRITRIYRQISNLKRLVAKMNYLNKYFIPESQGAIFAYLNLKLSRHINSTILKRLDRNVLCTDYPISEGRINTMLFRIAYDSEKTSVTPLILEKKIDRVISNLSSVPVVLLSFIKLRFDGYTTKLSDNLYLLNSDLKNINDNTINHFWFRELGPFYFVAADIYFRDKYAYDDTVTRIIDKVLFKYYVPLNRSNFSNGLNCQNKSNRFKKKQTAHLWSPLINRNILFYKNDLALTVIDLCSYNNNKVNYENYVHRRINEETNWRVPYSIFKFFRESMNKPNILLQIACSNSFNIELFLERFLSYYVNHKIPISVLICLGFNWSDYIFLIQFHKNKFYNSFKYLKNFLLFEDDLGITRSKTDVIFGLNVSSDVIVPVPEILIRLSSDSDSQKVLSCDLPVLSCWDVYIRPGNFDIVLIPKAKKCEYSHLNQQIENIISSDRLKVSDLQLRFDLPVNFDSD